VAGPDGPQPGGRQPEGRLADVPENYHTVSYQLDEHGGTTHPSLSQDNNGDEAEAQRATQNWDMMLTALKRTVEDG
jgi:Activator of Hsp90 ATPase homolog 1-like protein